MCMIAKNESPDWLEQWPCKAESDQQQCKVADTECKVVFYTLRLAYLHSEHSFVFILS